MKAMMRRFNQWMRGPCFAVLVCGICCAGAICSFYAAVQTDPQPQGLSFVNDEAGESPHIEIEGELRTSRTSIRSQKMRIELPSAVAQVQKPYAAGGDVQQEPLHFVRSCLIRALSGASKWRKAFLNARAGQRAAWERDRRTTCAFLHKVASSYVRTWRRYHPQTSTGAKVSHKPIPDSRMVQPSALKKAKRAHRSPQINF